MGYQLWIAGDTAWAQGTYEYRALGAAVIAATDLFRGRDFHPRARVPAAARPGYAGHFASLGDMNHELKRRRKARVSKRRAGGG